MCRLCASASASVPWGLRFGLWLFLLAGLGPLCHEVCASALVPSLGACASAYVPWGWRTGLCAVSARVPRPLCLGGRVPTSVAPRPGAPGAGPTFYLGPSVWHVPMYRASGGASHIVLLGAPPAPQLPGPLGPGLALARPRGPVARSHGRCPGLLLLHALSIAERVGRRSVPTSVATRLGAPGAPRLYWPRGPVARSRGRCPGLSLLHGLSIAVRVRGPFRPPRPWPLGPWRWGPCA